MEVWKQRHGSSATYKNLFHVFQRAGYQDYADIVRKIIGKADLIMIFIHCDDYGTVPQTNRQFLRLRVKE